MAGRGGHPVLLGRRAFAAIAALGLDGGGLRAFLAARAADVLRLPVDDEGVRQDVDTPDDYTRFIPGAR